jgi:hypothetical protein
MAVELELRVGAVCSQIKSEGRSQGALPTVATRSGSVGAGAQERYLVGKARDWIAAHRAEITLSLRITVAGLIALALGELFGVKQVYWAVLTAVIVMQASVGGSLKATMDRLAAPSPEPSGARRSALRSRIRERSRPLA